MDIDFAGRLIAARLSEVALEIKRFEEQADYAAKMLELLKDEEAQLEAALAKLS